ncbi:MAG: ATP-binding protein [Cuniculiplasma sp.]
MDKTQAMRKFVKENILKLTSAECDKEVEKQLRRDFAEKNRLRTASRFTANDVAEEIVKYLLRTRVLDLNEFMQETAKIKFINQHFNEQKLGTLFNTYKDSNNKLILNVDDLRNLHNKQFILKIEEEFKKKANERSNEESEDLRREVDYLRQQLEEKDKQLSKYDSDLKVPIEFKIEDLERQIVQSELPIQGATNSHWWQILGLSQNPFETNQGLYWLSKEKYDDVVVQTPLIKKYADDISRNPDSFSNKTIILAGEFGSGKTTVFQYLTNPATVAGLMCVYIIMNPSPSVSNLTNIFLEQLLDNLSEVYFQIYHTDPRSKRPSGNLYNDCLELLRLLGNDAPKGFLVFVDGLHKTDSYFEQVLEFLKQLQNVQEYFANKSIKLGTIVAGSRLWENEFARRPSLSGSFYRIDSIPHLTEELALEAVKKRINSFSTRNDETIRIEESGLKQAFKVLNERLKKEITFRDYLDHIRERLDLNQFEEIGLSVKVHVETVDIVRASIKRSQINDQYLSLLSEVESSIKLRKAFQLVLTSIYRKGASETEQIYLNYKPVFILLKKHDLLVQKKSTTEPTFKWHLSDEFMRTIVQICDNLKLKPGRVLFAAFEQETLSQSSEAETIYGGVLSTIVDFKNSWTDSFPEIANLLKLSAVAITQVNNNIRNNQPTNSDNFKLPLKWLAEAINRIIYANHNENEDQWLLFSKSWAIPENIDELSKYAFGDFEIPDNRSQLYGFLHNHTKALSQLSKILSDQVKGEGISRLNGRELTVTQFQKIHSLRMKFLSQMYEEVVDGVCSLLEENIREVFYPCMRALWGNDSIKLIPDEVRKRISELSSRGNFQTRRDSDENFFYDMARGEYTEVLSVKDIRKGLFSEIIKTDDFEKFKNYLNLSFSLDNRVAHRDRKKYFSQHSTEIGDILKDLPKNLEIFHKLTQEFLMNCDVQQKVANGTLITKFKPSLSFSFPSKEFTVTKDTIDKITQTLLESIMYSGIAPQNLNEIFSYSKQEPESLISVFRALLAEGHILIFIDIFKPIEIRITDKGRELMTKYNKLFNT